MFLLLHPVSSAIGAAGKFVKKKSSAYDDNAVHTERGFTTRIERAARLPFSRKLATGEISDITNEDIEEMMEFAKDHAKSRKKKIIDAVNPLAGRQEVDETADLGLMIDDADNPNPNEWISEHSHRWMSESSQSSEPPTPLTPMTPSTRERKKVKYMVEMEPEAVKLEWLLTLFQYIFGCTDHGVEALRRFFKPSRDGYVTRRKVAKALKVDAVAKYLEALMKDRASDKPFIKHRRPSNSAVAGISVSFFAETVIEQASQDDSMETLILTIMYTTVLVGVIITHLQVYSRHAVARSLKHVLTNPRLDLHVPAIYEDVSGMSDFVSWLNETGFLTAFGRVSSRDGSEFRAMLGATSFLVGDAQLRWRTAGSEATHTQWLLTDAPGQPFFLQNNPGQYLTAARATLSEIWTPEWLEDMESLSWVFCTYSDRAQMYSLNKVQFTMRPFGLSKPIVSISPVVIDAYPVMPLSITLDSFYLLFILYQLWNEGKEVVTALTHGGCRALIHHMNPWNVVDWTNIFVGSGNCAVWICCCLAMQAESLRRLLDEDFRAKKVMDLRPEQVLQVEKDVEQLRDLFFYLHMLTAVNIVSIMMKFYKGFHVNARLELVVQTMKTSAVNIMHFCVVFGTILLAGGILGYVLFGNDLHEFGSMPASLNTITVLLLGESGWYGEAMMENDADGELPSGVPTIVVGLWYAVVVGGMVLVLVNIMLAILMEGFGEVYSQGPFSEAPTLLVDFREFMERRRATRQCNLHSIVSKIQSRNSVAFPSGTVDLDSLITNYPSMPLSEAAWLMQWIARERRNQMKTRHAMQASSAHTMLTHIEEILKRVYVELLPLSTRMANIMTRVSVVQSRLASLQEERFRKGLGKFRRKRKLYKGKSKSQLGKYDYYHYKDAEGAHSYWAEFGQGNLVAVICQGNRRVFKL